MDVGHVVCLLVGLLIWPVSKSIILPWLVENRLFKALGLKSEDE